MELIYYPNHAERYAHIPEWERAEYPDEVRIGGTIIQRTKLFAELTHEDIAGYIDPCLVARDIPIRKALKHFH